jgi:hypothetical protein
MTTRACNWLLRNRLQRSFTSSSRLAQTIPAQNVPPPPVTSTVTVAPVQKKRVGGIRGGYSSLLSHMVFSLLIRHFSSIVGFLFGFSLASAFASYHLLEEYRLASAILQSSVHVSICFRHFFSIFHQNNFHRNCKPARKRHVESVLTTSQSPANLDHRFLRTSDG